MNHSRTRRRRAGLRSTGCLLLTLLLAPAAPAQPATYFDPPAVWVKAGANQDYDVSSDLAPLIARRALTVGENGSGKTIVQAAANLNNRRGFRVNATTKSPNENSLAPFGEGIVVMDLVTYDPLGRDLVKVEVDFDAIANAGAPLPYRDFSNPGRSAFCFFLIEVGAIGTTGSISTFPDGSENVAMPEMLQPALLRVAGYHTRSPEQTGETNASLLITETGGQTFDRQTGNGTLVASKKFVLKVAPGTAHAIRIKATAGTNGFTFVDPVVTAHPDNPEVVVSIRGAIDPNPPPLATLSRDELAAAGIDLAPLEDLDLLDPPTSIQFLSPEPDAGYKAGAAIPTKFRLLDEDGAPIADADAKSLVAECRVKAGLDTATSCARYNARKDFFLSRVKVARDANPGMHEVAVQVLDAAGEVTDGAAADVSIRPRGRTGAP